MPCSPPQPRTPLLILATLVATLSIAGTASATPGPADDRLVQTPTAWMVRKSISVAELTDINNAGTWRVTDLRVENNSPLTLSATFVKNAGAYAVSGAFFYHGVTLTDAAATFEANNKRPIIMQAYVDDNGVTRVCGITVPNTGANHRSWRGIMGSYDFVTSNLPVGFRPMTIGTFLNDADQRRYVVLAVANTESYAWWWYFGVHASDLDSLAGPHSSIIDGSADDNDAMQLNVVFYNLPTTHGVTQGTPFFDTSYADLVQKASSYQNRALFITHYTLHGSGTADGDTEYFSSFVDNY